MIEKVVPMIHVSDVRATVDWYRSIGFKVLNTYGDEGDGISFAILSFGSTQVMFNQGGEPSSRFRREVDLYIYTDKIDDLYQQLKDRVEVVEGPHDTFYGMRELIIRDLNRFWITFGQSSAFDMLISAVRDRNIDLIRAALDRNNLKPETLTAALAVVSTKDENDTEIANMLKKAGAIPPAEVDDATLQSYTGKYKNELGFEINVTFKDGKLFAAPGAQAPLRLMAVDKYNFKPVEFDDYGTLTFNEEGGKTVGCALRSGAQEIQLKRD